MLAVRAWACGFATGAFDCRTMGKLVVGKFHVRAAFLAEAQVQRVALQCADNVKRAEFAIFEGHGFLISLSHILSPKLKQKPSVSRLVNFAGPLRYAVGAVRAGRILRMVGDIS